MKRKVVTTVVVNNDKKVLLLKRSKVCPFAGFWNFPGGSVDKDEELVEAATREVAEETGLIIAGQPKHIGQTAFRKITLDYFITKDFSGDVTLNAESEKYLWVSPEDLVNYEFPIRKLKADILAKIIEFVYGE